MATTEQTATVHVYQAAPGLSHLRWFELPTSLHVASYSCTPWDEEELGDQTPHPENVRGIMKRHPGCDLIYLDATGAVSREVGLTP